MIHRMTAAVLSLIGFFISAYLYLYKIGRIGTLACGTGGCETVQQSPWSRFAGVEVSLIGLVGYAGLLGGEFGRPAARCGGAGLARQAAGHTRRNRRRVYRVSDLSRAVRHPCHLPLVCWLGGHHHFHLHCGAPGASQALPHPELVALVPQGQISVRQAARPPGVRRSWRGLWRHRNQPAVCLQRVLLRSAQLPGNHQQRAGHPVAHLLVAELRGHVQVPLHGDAGGQPGRGRDPCAPGAGSAQWPDQHERTAADRDRTLRVGTALWRRDHYPGHLGTERRGGTQRGHAGPRAPGGAHRLCDHPGAIRPATAGHGWGGCRLRAHHRDLVHLHRHSRGDGNQPRARGAAGTRSPLRRGFLRSRGPDRHNGSCGRHSGGHRGRSPVCRHGALRPAPDTAGVVRR